MRIAYISYEYPKDTDFGGISTYVAQVAKVMKQKGHQVDVYCGSDFRTCNEVIDGINVFRTQAIRDDFSKSIVAVFSENHDKEAYDIIESPEYGADGYWIKMKYPSLPLIVKLHTPSYLINIYNTFCFARIFELSKLKNFAKAFIRYFYYRYYIVPKTKNNDLEYQITKLATEIHTPSISLGQISARDWNIPMYKIVHVPNPFVPNDKLLKIENDKPTNYITFIGNLQVRKGVLIFSRIIPKILEKHPEVKFRFVGRDMLIAKYPLTVKQYMEKKLRKYQNNVEFCSVTNSEIPGILEQTDICVYPSYWENFPNVCLEAMSAGKAVIGSKFGGMKDMLENPISGKLINPYNEKELTNAILDYLDSRDLQLSHGKIARQKVLDSYSYKVIGNLIENRYNTAINKI